MPKTRRREKCVSRGGRAKIDRYVRERSLTNPFYDVFNPGGLRRRRAFNVLPFPKGGAAGEEVAS